MTLKTQMAADLSSVFYATDEFAASVTYTQIHFSPDVSISIDAIISYGEGDEFRGADSYGVRARIRVKASDVAQPEQGDEITIDGSTWVVIGAEPVMDGLEWAIEINKKTA